MLEYFMAEMRILQESAQAFAERYPGQASQLNLANFKDRDPYVERLLEGVAYLNAAIKHRIDDDLPDISETLLNQIWPHLLKPFPAMTVMQFIPNLARMQQSYFLPKGTRIFSPANKDNLMINCRFQTTHSVTINPVSIEELTTEPSKYGGTVFKIRLATGNNICFDQLKLDKLNFYLHADNDISLELYFALVAQVDKVIAIFPKYHDEKIIMGNQEAITLTYLSPKQSLLNVKTPQFAGLQLLFDYFSWREKYFFFEIKKLNAIVWPKNCRNFVLEIHSKYFLPDTLLIDKKMLQMHCVPAINLYQTSSEPIRLDHTRSEYPINVPSSTAEETCLFSVDTVTGIEVDTGLRVDYQPLESYSHLVAEKECFTTYCRKLSGSYPKLTIAFANNKNAKLQHISCSISVCDGYWPRLNLKENTITHSDSDVPPFMSTTNLTRPSALLLPPNRKYYQWLLISNLALNFHSVANINALKQLLQIYDWSGRVDNQRKIQGLQAIEIKKTSKILSGAVVHGVLYQLTVNEVGFQSLADIHLFGSVLQAYLVQYANFHSYIETKIVCLPSQREFVWPISVNMNQSY